MGEDLLKVNHKSKKYKIPRRYFTKSAFTCLKLTIETLEQGVKYVQS